MTAEELLEILKVVNANRPQVSQTMNFNAPIGQQIAHVDKIEAHFDKDMGMQIVRAEEVGADLPEEEESADEGEPAPHAVPQDCTDAVGKVILPTFMSPQGTVLYSAKQIANASQYINLGSNSQVAMLMAVGLEVDAVRPGSTCIDFVRALIGLKLIPYTDNKTIESMASGMMKKLAGYTKGDKKYPPLPSSHMRWGTKDFPIGKSLYEAMTTQE